jgi:NAD(P)H-hydrate epimerase
MLVDADGLFWLGQFQRQSRHIAGGGELYLTPHGGEAAGLLECSVQQVSSDRLGALSDMAGRYEALGLIKGPGTVMGNAQEHGICGHGNPGMATAGMGDVLAGLAGSLMAQHPDHRRSAFFAAVVLHSAAGDLTAEDLGMRPLTASAVIERIGQLLKD